MERHAQHGRGKSQNAMNMLCFWCEGQGIPTLIIFARTYIAMGALVTEPLRLNPRGLLQESLTILMQLQTPLLESKYARQSLTQPRRHECVRGTELRATPR